MNYEQAKRYRDRFYDEHDAATAQLVETGQAIADRLGIEPRGAMGMTPDAIKLDPEYQAAWKSERQAFANLREFNKQFARLFRRQIREERRQKEHGA